jgi:hypothetical protein
MKSDIGELYKKIVKLDQTILLTSLHKIIWAYLSMTADDIYLVTMVSLVTVARWLPGEAKFSMMASSPGQIPHP